MLSSSAFGEQLDKDNGWLSDIMTPLSLKGKSQLEKAQKIFSYVRDNYTCTTHSDPFPGLIQTLKNVVKSRNGTVSELNILLATCSSVTL